MQTATIYVRDPLRSPRALLSADDQETACREYCLARNLTVVNIFSDMAGSRDEFTKMIAQATQGDSSLDFIVVWKLHMFSRSLEETIELRDKLRRAGTRLVSVTEKGTGD